MIPNAHDHPNHHTQAYLESKLRLFEAMEEPERQRAVVNLGAAPQAAPHLICLRLPLKYL